MTILIVRNWRARQLHPERILRTFGEIAIARYELTAASGPFLHVPTWNMELALQNAAVMAWGAISMPVILFASVTNARDAFSAECP